jgi:hypothetical protein
MSVNAVKGLVILIFILGFFSAGCSEEVFGSGD